MVYVEALVGRPDMVDLDRAESVPFPCVFRLVFDSAPHESYCLRIVDGRWILEGVARHDRERRAVYKEFLPDHIRVMALRNGLYDRLPENIRDRLERAQGADGAQTGRDGWAPQALDAPVIVAEAPRPETASPAVVPTEPSSSKAPPSGQSVADLPGRPTPEMFKAFLATESGIRQRAIAEQLKVSQATVSRHIKRVKAWVAVGGEVPGLAELNPARPKVISVDPRKLDRGGP
jgi:hypothetical protein